MKDWYFYQELGRTMGPLTAADMRGRIREGRIRMFDLVYREGESGWRMALEHAELRAEFRNLPTSSLKGRPWVCLRRKSKDSLEFMTTGPFSQEEIQEAILAGQIAYTDYVWRQGFKEWKRIGTLEDFNRRLRKEYAELPPIPADSPEELLKNVVEFRRGQAPRPAEPPPPPEAAGEDLTQIRPPTIPAEQRPKPPEPKPEVKPEPRDEAKPEAKPEPRKESPKKSRARGAWVDWLIVLGLIVGVAGVVYFVSKRLPGRAPEVAERPLPEPALEAPPPLPPPLEPSPEAVAKAAKPEPAPAPSKPPPPKPMAPTELTLNVQAVTATQARIEIRTNGTADFPVYLQVIGHPGQVTEGPSYYRFLRLKPSGDPRQPLDLGGLSLPQGRFTLSVESGDLRKEANLNLGVNESDYRQAVARARKQHAHAIWRDRLAAYRSAQLLAQRLVAVQSGGKLSLKGLEAVTAVKRSAGANYPLFEDWWELKGIADEARKQVSPALVERAERARERLASLSVWKWK